MSETGTRPESSDPSAPLGDFVALRQLLRPEEAHILQARLDAEGILAIASDTNVSRAFGIISDSFNGSSVRVPASQLARAQAIVQEISAGDFVLTDEMAGVSTEDETPATETPAAPAGDPQHLAFCGDPHFPAIWASGRLRFNFTAFLLGGIWCFYRKLYAPGAMVLIADQLVLLGVVQLHQAGELAGLGVSSGLLYILLLSVLIRIPLGLGANALYRRKAEQAIAHLPADLDETGRLARLRKLGGISMGAALLAIALRMFIGIAFEQGF